MAIRYWIGCFGLLLVVLNVTSAQTPARPNLNEIITKYLAKTEEYTATFKNLTTEETKDIEIFNPDGSVKKRRRVVSELLVYQPTVATNDNWTAEYRSVGSVDGKPLPDAEKRAIKLFEQVSKSRSGYEEWERVRNEWAKYDIGQTWWGFTINQGVAIKASRSYYGFAYLGAEESAGRKSLVIYFRQLEPSPHYTGPTYLIDSIRLPPQWKRLPPMFVGKLWLDAETMQIWREERAMLIYLPNDQFSYSSYAQMRTVLSGATTAALPSLMLARWVLSYQPSEFGILTPKEIEINLYDQFYQEKNEAGLGRAELRLGHRTRYSYGAFKRFNVTGEETKREILKEQPKPE